MFSKKHRNSFLVGGTCVALLALPLEFTEATGAPALGAQTAYTTPEDGFRALVLAVKNSDLTALRAMLGPDSDALLSSGDPVDDKDARERFVAAYNSEARIARPRSNSATLSIGADRWEFPIPMEKTADGWRFDTDRGRDELLNRRIGRNELNVIQACLAFVDAERDYASTDHNGDAVLQYADRFISSPNKQDGLYWPQIQGKAQSPLGEFFAKASAAGYQLASAPENHVDEGDVLYGYRYQILAGQGPAARGGAYDYIINQKMIGGFGMVAYPANYGVSGVMTFIVNHDGQVYQKDLGPDTATLAPAIQRFNPDKTWKRTGS